MSKKETTGEKFENFMSFAIKYKVEKKPNINQIIKRVRKELEEVAKELNLPIENIKVLHTWCEQGGRYNDELFIKLIAPTYFPSPKYKVEWNEKFEQHIAILA